jgi:Phosphoglyceromutase
MDRDKRWERIKLAYDLVVNGFGEHSQDVIKSIQNSYDNDITDEFIKPIVITDEQLKPIATISEDDVVIFFNFRTDRGRELTEALSQQDFLEYGMHKMNLHYVTMTNYDDTFKNVHVIYDKDNLNNTLGEVLQNNEKTQIRIAENRKIPSCYFLFSGGRGSKFLKEKNAFYVLLQK